MKIMPMTLREANDFVEAFHRHSKRTARDGGKFAIGLGSEDGLVGVAIVGRPLSRILDDGFTAEVTRCCVTEKAPKGACSKLYARCWKIWAAMGGTRLVTYTLQTESGASLNGAGWKQVAKVAPHRNGWTTEKSDRYRAWQPIYGQQKFRWEIAL